MKIVIFDNIFEIGKSLKQIFEKKGHQVTKIIFSNRFEPRDVLNYIEFINPDWVVFGDLDENNGTAWFNILNNFLSHQFRAVFLEYSQNPDKPTPGANSKEAKLIAEILTWFFESKHPMICGGKKQITNDILPIKHQITIDLN